MAESSEAHKALLLRFNITQILQIRLTRLKVYTFSKKEGKAFKCQTCRYSSNRKCDLQKHLRTHTGEKPYHCILCNYRCSQRSDLNKHITTHTGEKHYKCAFCTKSFASNGSKSCHEKTCKLNPRQSDPSWVEMQKVFRCQLCPYSTARNSSFICHKISHTGKKPFSCNLCDQKFNLRSNWQKHIVTHTGEKPHNCQFCTRGFAQVAHQKRHEQICTLNPKQSDAKWIEEQKKFKCHVCKYKTMTKRSLKTHLRSHTGENPWICPLCFNKLSQNSNLHRHLRDRHTTENCHKCPECKFTTLSTSMLLQHIKGAHVTN